MVVVERVDERISMLVAELERTLVCVVVDTGHKANLRTKTAGSLNLAYRCALRQADKRLYAVACSTERNTLGMVAG